MPVPARPRGLLAQRQTEAATQRPPKLILKIEKGTPCELTSVGKIGDDSEGNFRDSLQTRLTSNWTSPQRTGLRSAADFRVLLSQCRASAPPAKVEDSLPPECTRHTPEHRCGRAPRAPARLHRRVASSPRAAGPHWHPQQPSALLA